MQDDKICHGRQQFGQGFDVFFSFGQHQRRATFAESAEYVSANHLIPRLIMEQFFVQLMEFKAHVRLR